MKHPFLFRIIVLVLLLITASADFSDAQCSMCRRIAETSMEDDASKRGRGLNSGILYLMAVPYAMGGIAGLIWWKYRRAGDN
jgi:hypothetical protein